MNFTAPAFVLLFPIVLALHWMLPPSRRWVLLLAASLGFYAVGSPQALPLLAGITLGTYAAALGIAKSKTQTAKKLWLKMCIRDSLYAVPVERRDEERLHELLLQMGSGQHFLRHGGRMGRLPGSAQHHGCLLYTSRCV